MKKYNTHTYAHECARPHGLFAINIVWFYSTFFFFCFMCMPPRDQSCFRQSGCLVREGALARRVKSDTLSQTGVCLLIAAGANWLRGGRFTMFGEHVISRAVWLAHVRRRRRVGGARERASRCRRPGFHECLNRGIDQGWVSPGSAAALGGLSSRHTCRSDDSLFIRTARLIWRLFDAYTPAVYSAHIFIQRFNDRRLFRLLYQ